MERQTVTAYRVVPDVPALNAYPGRVFGAVEKFRVIGSAGGYHTEAQIGGTMLMLGGGRDVAWKGEACPMAFHLYVPDTGAAYRRALDHGGESLQARPTRTGESAPPTSKTPPATSGTSPLSRE